MSGTEKLHHYIMELNRETQQLQLAREKGWDELANLLEERVKALKKKLNRQ